MQARRYLLLLCAALCYSFVLLQLYKAEGKAEEIIWNVRAAMALFYLGTSMTSHCPAHFHPSASHSGASWVKQQLCIGDQTGGWSPVKGNHASASTFPNLLSMALTQLNIWAIAFSIVPARAVFAVLDPSRLFSQQSATSYLSKEEISLTPFACVLTF